MVSFVVEAAVGALFSASLKVLFDRVASREFINLFKRHQFDQTLLKRLTAALLTINAVLSDAEEKQITNPFVKQWVDEVKDATYRADDLLDEIATVELKCDAEAESQGSNNHRQNPGSTHNHICADQESRLKEMIVQLEQIAKQKDVIELKEGLGGRPSPRLPTTSLVNESEVFGREKDKEKIMDILLSPTAKGDEIPLIAIIGIAGVGKTTLAQLLYNDAKVKNHFSKRVWVHVSEQFDVFMVTRTIYEAVTSRHCIINDLDILQVRLKERLTRRRFLLVLDDVWNEDFSNWDSLRNFLDAGDGGSRIIVTTQSQNVASTMHAVLKHPLHQLSFKDCLSVFERHAFRGGNCHEYSKLKQIGEQIAKKCQGLPLAAKTIGCLMHSKVEPFEWDSILNSTIWDLPYSKSYILPSLRLSYHYLLPHLKRCFAYCSIFPKGYKFEKEKLILLWMAEGFLPQHSNEKRMEEVGSSYFDELLSRSFFQQSSENESLFMMHDLINELAEFVSCEFCLKFESGKSHRISEKARHFSYERDQFGVMEKLEDLQEVTFLRTFLPLSSSSNPTIPTYLNEMVVKKLLPTLRCLRVLSLSHYRISEVPNIFDRLSHLRYLDFSRTLIKALPDSICSLYNLQTLLLSNCPNFVELPAKMRYLIELCHLDVTGTKLKEMPPGFGRLKSLRTLTTFVVSKGSGSSIGELGRLLHLHGKLSILELQNVENDADAEDAQLKDKKNIKELVLSWKNGHDVAKETDVLEKLRPHENIEKLAVEKYAGTKLPSWLGDSSFSKMSFLRLSDCKNCSSLSSLGQLSSLKELHIAKLEGLESIGPEFYGSGSEFKSLHILKFEDMPNWKQWSSVASQGFPSLQELHIRRCKNLSGNLPSCLPSLKLLHVDECKSLETLFEDMVHYKELRTLRIKKSCDSLTSFRLGFSNKLEILKIWDCSHIESIEASKDLQQDLKSLQASKIGDCSNYQNLISESQQPSNLKYFSVSNCSSLMSMPEQMHMLLTSLQELHISRCPKLKSFPQGGLPRELQSFSIENCGHLTPHMEWGLNEMMSLTFMKIIGCGGDLNSFPENGLLPTSLISLQISEFPKLEVLHLKGLVILTSLQMLMIDSCESLQCLSEEGTMPASLSSLIINECPLMTPRFQEQGQDWFKIRHISKKVVNGMDI